MAYIATFFIFVFDIEIPIEKISKNENAILRYKLIIKN